MKKLKSSRVELKNSRYLKKMRKKKLVKRNSMNFSIREKLSLSLVKGISKFVVLGSFSVKGTLK